MTREYSPDTVRRLLSPYRLRPYLDQADGDPAKALELYEWSGRMASAAFETVGHLEVMMRNAIDCALCDHFDEAGSGIPWLLRRPPMSEETLSSVEFVRDRLRPLGRDTRHQIVAGLSFGFWSGMLGRRVALRHAFPGSSGARKQVAAAVEAVRKFRNRLAHHDSMLSLDIPFEIRRVMLVAGYLCADAQKWLSQVDRSAEVYRQRPHTVIDTVVVPAREAWPFYEEHHAYICQAGRWFRPVDRIAFYADRQIKEEVPRILHRRDDVPWTDQYAAHLGVSTDRNDRKIATVIDAARKQGWDGGIYQVFLLTRSGDPDHRTLPNPVSHVTGGRGSAFGQRQRYVALHALETSQSTADLRRETEPT